MSATSEFKPQFSAGKEDLAIGIGWKNAENVEFKVAKAKTSESGQKAEQLLKLIVSQVFSTFHNILTVQQICFYFVTSLKAKEEEAAAEESYGLQVSTHCPCTSTGSSREPKYNIIWHSMKLYYGSKVGGTYLHTLSSCLWSCTNFVSIRRQTSQNTTTTWKSIWSEITEMEELKKALWTEQLTSIRPSLFCGFTNPRPELNCSDSLCF